MGNANPSDIRLALDQFAPQEAASPLGTVAVDTETSGLFADDGARVSTASVAWMDPTGEWTAWAKGFDNVTTGEEVIAEFDLSDGSTEQYTVDIVSVAWPFDQGTDGKPEDDGQPKLWPEADNLGLDEWRSLVNLLADHNLTMHNAKFDLEKLRVGVRRWPGIGVELEENVVWDSQNVNDLLWRLHPTSLKPTCARLFGKEWADEATVVKKYLTKAKLPQGRWDLMPWDAIGKYADTDARITLMLMLRQQYEIDSKRAGKWLGSPDDVYEMIERRLAVTKVLYRMERRGLPYDEVTSREVAFEARKRAEAVGKKLPFTPTPEKAKKYFFGDGITDRGVECLSMVPYSVTEKGSPQLTAEIVARMIDDRVTHAETYGEFTRLSNAASMWYEGYADAVGLDGRIRTAFRQNGTRSSRFSVERINLQAIPQDYRLSDHSALAGLLTPRQIIANAVPEGWRLFELDLAQAELRVGAMFANCRLMIEMIADNADLHTYTTKSLFPDVSEDDPLFGSKWRQVGKRGNFSLGFGSGGKTFKGMVSKETGIQLSEQEANRIVADWNALYPEWRQAIDKHMRVVGKRQARHGFGWIDLVNRERRWFQEYEEAHKAFNQRVQSNLAQFGIDWMLQTDRFLRNEAGLHRGAQAAKIGEPGLVLTIHDSQVLLLPDNEYGRELAETCAGFGKDLWKQMFAGIPGDVDYHAWDRVAV